MIVAIVALLHPFLYWGMYAGDAVIYLMYGENASQGNYFEFNVGEKSAGATSPGHMLVLSAIFSLFPDNVVPVIVKGLTIIFWYGLLVLLFMFTRSLFDDYRLACIATLILALLPGAVYNATIGMENGIFAFFIFLWMWLVFRWGWFSNRNMTIAREITLGLLLGAACWIRPEGFIVFVTAILYRLFLNRQPLNTLVAIGRRSLILTVPFLIVVAGLIYFHFSQTGRLVPSSAVARMIMSYQQSFRIGFIMFNPKFIVRLMCYFPLTLFWLIGAWAVCTKRSISRNQDIERFFSMLFMIVFIIYSTVLGSAHLARYTIFIMPAMVIGSMRGLSWVWENRGSMPLPKKAPSMRVIFLVLAGFLGVVFAIETRMRLDLGSPNGLAALMKVPGERRRLSDELYQRLGNPSSLPIAIACQEVQMRYWLDERFVIRSLDGRVDSVLLQHYRDGNVDHIGYIKERNIDFIVGTPNYNRDKAAWGLDRLHALDPSESTYHEGLIFRRLPVPGYLFRVEHHRRNWEPRKER
jgi:hypothetical protein